MKDRVFIAWSGSNKVALLVKDILEKKYNYVCSIGGNSDNSSRFASVGDTVIQQIKSCNQAIVIFQNKAGGAVSNNLFFELGYVLSLYGTRKVHCVKREGEDVVLPSDFDNSFVESVADGAEDEKFAEGIVEYFMGRQKMSINENKMYLINNRYLIHDKIASHYSEFGSKCSDYELAQYILFYVQAAHMFGDEKKVQKELLEFKHAHNFEFSAELSLAVNLGLSFFDMVRSIKTDPQTADAYIDQEVFWKFKNDYAHYEKSIVDDTIGIFDEWMRVFVNEHLAFAYMLFANSATVTPEMRLMMQQKIVDYALRALECIEILEQRAPCRENNDEVGLISLFRAYIYRNLFLAKQQLGEGDAEEWLAKTLKERESLKNSFDRGTIDSKLYDNFCMEYYLSLVNYLSFHEGKVDDFEVLMYKSEIKSYLSAVAQSNSENAFMKQIELFCK